MNFEEWEPIYLEILEDMGYELERDLAAATLLESICPLDRICGESCLDEIIGEVVTVVGHGPNLEEELDRVEVRGNLISADGSTSALLEREMIPDIIVTDLDGEIGPEIECNGKGSIAAIHAHGDNMVAVRKWLPQFPGKITPTVQCEPFGCLFNFGGFTDGDRAALLAQHFGASRIHLVGFDFDRPREKGAVSKVTKRRKLQWARRIIQGAFAPERIIMSDQKSLR